MDEGESKGIPERSGSSEEGEGGVPVALADVSTVVGHSHHGSCCQTEGHRTQHCCFYGMPVRLMQLLACASISLILAA